MDRLTYGCCTFPVHWSGSEGAYLASVLGLRAPLSAPGATRWEAFAELNRRLSARFQRAQERALMHEAPGYAAAG